MPKPLKRGQAAVEYTVLMIFLFGFIIAAGLPAVKANELSQALAIARQTSVEYVALHPELYLTKVDYTEETDQTPTRIDFNPTLFKYDEPQPTATPDDLKLDIVGRICINTPDNIESNGPCCKGGSYKYCVI